MQTLVRTQDNASPIYWELKDASGVSIDGSTCDWKLLCKAELSRTAVDAMTVVTGTWDAVNNRVIFDLDPVEVAALLPGTTYFLQANGINQGDGAILYTEQAKLQINASLGTGIPASPAP